MKTDLGIITIVNSVGPTSMPHNEFVLFRQTERYDRSHKIVCLKPASADTTAEVAIVSANGRLSRFARLLWETISKSLEPSVAHFHHPRTAAIGLVITRMFRRGRPLATVFTVHSSFERYSIATKVMSLVSVLLADHATFVSQAAAEAYPAIIKRLKRGRLHVIQNGVDTGRISGVLRRELGIDARDSSVGQKRARLRLITVARLIPLKNLEFLLSVILEVANVELVVVGDGPQRSSLEATVRDYGLDSRVSFRGLISREEVFQELDKADVFVSTSRYEGLPVAVLEAMAVGLPVVLSDIPPHKEVASGSQGARLVGPSLSLWVEALETIEQITPTARRRWGQLNKEVVEENFSLQAMHRLYTSIYKRAVRTRKT